MRAHTHDVCGCVLAGWPQVLKLELALDDAQRSAGESQQAISRLTLERDQAR